MPYESSKPDSEFDEYGLFVSSEAEAAEATISQAYKAQLGRCLHFAYGMAYRPQPLDLDRYGGRRLPDDLCRQP
jgi:hypothetical protein